MLVLLSISYCISSSWLGYTRPSSKAKLLLHFAACSCYLHRGFLKRQPLFAARRLTAEKATKKKILVEKKKTNKRGGVRAESAFYPAFSRGCSLQLCPAGTCLPLGACGIAVQPVVAAKRPDLPLGMPARKVTAQSQITGSAITSGSWGFPNNHRETCYLRDNTSRHSFWVKT